MREGLFECVTCERQIGELERVLARPKLARQISAEIAAEFVEWLRRACVCTPDPVDVPPVSPDPDDDYLVALADVGRALVIVTGDAHLLGLSPALAEPRIMSPTSFAVLVEGLR